MRIKGINAVLVRGLKAVASTALILCACGCESDNAVLNFPHHIYEIMSGVTPLNSARKMEDPNFPDERREGINELAAHGWGRRPPYTVRYRELALNDPDFTVRAVAVRALNRARDADSTDIFMRALEDSSYLVRLEAAKALANVPDPKASGRLVRIVGDPNENKDVRIAAADALRHYKSLDVARALVSQLNDKDFSVSWQSHESLRTLTGNDLQYNESAWLTYLTGPQSPVS